MHANYNRIKSDNVCAIIVIKLSEFVRLVRLSEIVGHEKESQTGQSDSDTSPTKYQYLFLTAKHARIII